MLYLLNKIQGVQFFFFMDNMCCVLCICQFILLCFGSSFPLSMSSIFYELPSGSQNSTRQWSATSTCLNPPLTCCVFQGQMRLTSRCKCIKSKQDIFSNTCLVLIPGRFYCQVTMRLLAHLCHDRYSSLRLQAGVSATKPVVPAMFHIHF